MSMLSAQKCVPCEGGTLPLKGQELELMKKRLNSEAPGWKVTAKQLRKNYRFKDFATALDFVNKVGAVAEEAGHHPNIEFGWGFVSITLWTHAINGLSENDFILAAKLG